MSVIKAAPNTFHHSGGVMGPFPGEIVIPKIFHRIWLGGEKMPDEFERWGESWARLNPGWTMMTWTEHNLKTKHQALIDKCCHLSQRSNIYRYEIVAALGGIYVDTDYECLRPIEPLLGGVKAFTSWKKNAPHFMSAIFGAVPGHPWTADLNTNVVKVDPQISLALGSSYITQHVMRHPEVVRFNSKRFCPIDHVDARRADAEILAGNHFETFPDAYAIHYWSSTFLPMGFQPLK